MFLRFLHSHHILQVSRRNVIEHAGSPLSNRLTFVTFRAILPSEKKAPRQASKRTYQPNLRNFIPGKLDFILYPKHHRRDFIKVFSLFRAKKCTKWKIASNESMTG